MNIGVFDSGLGGLTILKSLLKELPEYNYVYLGDNARVPYGNRSAETIYEFTKQAVDFLFKKNCKLVILACNTATSNALVKIQKEYLPKYFPDRRVLGVIKPTIENIKENNHLRVGIVGTKATVNSGAFVREIHKVLPKAEVYQQACPMLVPFIENGEKNEKILKLILEEYLHFLLQKKITTIVLACTHYGLIKKQFQDVVGPKIKVISEGRLVADKLRTYLNKHPEIEKNLDKKYQTEYFVTDLSPDYHELIRLFLGSHWKDTKINLINLSS